MKKKKRKFFLLKDINEKIKDYFHQKNFEKLEGQF